MANFDEFHTVISSSINLLFLKSVGNILQKKVYIRYKVMVNVL